MIAWNILSDALFAALAGIGFGAISDPPMRAFRFIAILAAAGHSDGTLCWQKPQAAAVRRCNQLSMSGGCFAASYYREC